MNISLTVFIRCTMLSLMLVVIVQSCKQKQQPEEFAVEWTNELKEKILKDANQQPDQVLTDTAHHEISLLKSGKILKRYYLVFRNDRHGDPLKIMDTAIFISYSTDQNFQYIIEPCIQGKDRSYECVAYRNDSYGFCRYIYCRTKTMQTGFQYKNTYVGSWISYDSAGKAFAKIDAGNADELLNLRNFYNPKDK